MVDEFADMDAYCNSEYDEEQNKRKKGMSVMVCPNCNADFYYADEKEKRNIHIY